MKKNRLLIILVIVFSVILAPLMVTGILIQLAGRICMIAGFILMINPLSARNELRSIIEELKDLWRNN